jgi:hypothetical protein
VKRFPGVIIWTSCSRYGHEQEKEKTRYSRKIENPKPKKRDENGRFHRLANHNNSAKTPFYHHVIHVLFFSTERMTTTLKKEQKTFV